MADLMIETRLEFASHRSMAVFNVSCICSWAIILLVSRVTPRAYEVNMHRVHTGSAHVILTLVEESMPILKLIDRIYRRRLVDQMNFSRKVHVLRSTVATDPTEIGPVSLRRNFYEKRSIM